MKMEIVESISVSNKKTPGIIRDPQILNADGKYYLTGTMHPIWKGDNKGVMLWSSDDLVDWQEEGLIIDRSKIPNDAKPKDRFWAPEIFHFKDKYLLTFSCENAEYSHPFCIWLAISDCIKGPFNFVDMDKPFIGYGIDASFFEDDGKLYVTFANLDIYFCEVDVNSFELIGEPKIIVKRGDTEEWDHVGIEGSYIVKEKDKFYIWYSSWTRGYEMGLAWTENINGQWSKNNNNPIISKIYDENNDWWCGHNCAFKTKEGKNAIAYHVHNKEVREFCQIDILSENYENLKPWAPNIKLD